jgi:hypothetical protein
VQANDQQTTVRAGDVVVFCSAAKHRSVVHRVMSVSAAGIRTRGDNNNGMDPDLLQPADISGKVTAVRRGRRITPIWNGAAGRWAIGRYAPGDQEWNIRRPFRLFLDVDTLPTA